MASSFYLDRIKRIYDESAYYKPPPPKKNVTAKYVPKYRVLKRLTLTGLML